MIKPDLHPHEQDRLNALKHLKLLDTMNEPDFDDVTFLATQICQTPIALISLIDDQRQWFKSKVGLSVCETPKDISFCAHAILQNDIFIVPDTSKDKRFFDNPLTTNSPFIQFYAGVPLLDPQSKLPMGTLCVIDKTPRHLNADQVQALKNLSQHVYKLLELRRSQSQLSSVQEKLSQQNQDIQEALFHSTKMASLGEMAGSIAHEINTPLAIILSAAQQIEKFLEQTEPNIEKSLYKIKKIETTAKRISETVRGLLIFSRNSKQDLAQTVSLKQIISDTVSLCGEKFSVDGIKLEIKDSQDFYVDCIPTQISQIILNLLNNAYDAIKGQTEPWIQVELEQRDRYVYLRVTDCGLGIPAEVVSKLMQPFFTTKQQGKGTGLGLSISKSIAKSFNGELEYQLHQGHTSFLLSLPLSQSSLNKE